MRRAPEKSSAPRSYCPGCEPDADATREILDVCWCASHAPARDGLDDALVSQDGFLSADSEAGGDNNRRWCEVIHREARRATGRRRAGLDQPSRRGAPAG
jgi:hypothetical protein